MQQPARPITCTGHALTWCDTPGCPGGEVQRKLETAEALLWAVKDYFLAERAYNRAVTPKDSAAAAYIVRAKREAVIATIAKAKGGA